MGKSSHAMAAPDHHDSSTAWHSSAEVELGPLASRLPYDILLQIFLEAVQMDPIEGQHGGKLRSWDDTRSLRNMPLISKAYEPAGEHWPWAVARCDEPRC